MLARSALETARADGVEVVPLCTYVAAYIRRHHEYLPLVAEPYRDELASSK
jgi:predicted GNAT family acetyltransferase